MQSSDKVTDEILEKACHQESVDSFQVETEFDGPFPDMILTDVGHHLLVFVKNGLL
jgi:hypothetical protein